MIINVIKNCQKSQLAQKIVRLAIFRNTRKIAIFAAACKPGHKWQIMRRTYYALLSSDGSNKAPLPRKLFSSNAVTICWFYRIANKRYYNIWSQQKSRWVTEKLFKIIILNNNTILQLHSHSKRSSTCARTQQKPNRETAWGKGKRSQNFLREFLNVFISMIYRRFHSNHL